ncbi:MAG: hypothetical protein JNM86_08500 [Phycisphaerae bacterium]|nr:hypothetical protein [Phycisphaerae bacterium]
MTRISDTRGDFTDTGLPTTGAMPPGAISGEDVLNMGAVGPRADFSSVSMRIDTVLRLGFSSRLERTDYPLDNPLGRVVRLSEVFTKMLKDFATAVKTINSDPSLTPIGKDRQLGNIGRDYIARVDSTVGQDMFAPYIRKALDRAAKAVEDAIQLPASDDVAALLREREVRDALRAMSPEERLAAWRRIVDSADPLGVAAVLNAPAFLPPLLHESIVKDGIAIVVGARSPNAVQAKEDADLAMSHLNMLRDEMRRTISEVSGVDLRPPREGLASANLGALA